MVVIGPEISMNFMTNVSIGFAKFENVGILMNKIIEFFQLLMPIYNWSRKCIEIDKMMVTLSSNNILDVYMCNDEYNWITICNSDRNINCIGGLNKQTIWDGFELNVYKYIYMHTEYTILTL